jgi:DNA-binding response OmpR family regulator
LYLFREAFKIHGFQVDAFYDYEQAITSFSAAIGNYDLIVMDLKLDGIDGRTVYKKFKEPDSRLKICVLTGLEVSIDQFKEFCPSFEEKYLMKKPVKLSALVESVKSILG